MTRRRANYVFEQGNDAELIIRDVGPWDEHPTVTNDAESVVAELLPRLNGRRLLYFDSNGDLAELRVRDGRFDGFGMVERPRPRQ